MAVDDGKQYVFMSSDLEGEIDLNPGREQHSAAIWTAIVIIDGIHLSLGILSIEGNDEGYSLQLQVGSFIDRFTSLLLDSSEFLVRVQERIFKAKVSKLESDRAYLKLSR